MTLRRFLESFPLPIIGLDCHRRVALWNAAAERLLGWSTAEVLGNEDPSVPCEVAGEHKTMFEAALRGDTAAGRETTRVTRRGNLLDIAVSTAYAPDEKLVVMFVVDQTAFKAEEERLADRETQLRLMLEQLPAIITTYDENLVVTTARGAGLKPLGADGSTFIGHTLAEIVGDDAPTVAAVRAALQGESSANEFQYRGRWYQNRTEPLRRRDGTIAGAMNLGYDITELRESGEQLRNLSAAMNRVQEDERRRVARELHDELGQLLTSLRLDLGIMRRDLHKATTAAIEQRIAGMLDLVDLTIKTVRRVATELRPAVLDDFGLRVAVEHELAAFAERTGIAVKLSVHGDEAIDAERATALFRIVQEGLTNVARHSGATRVDVRLEARGDRVEAELRDNGRGITEAEVNSISTLGLRGVRERAYALGGEALIEAESGEGTRVFVSIPQ